MASAVFTITNVYDSVAEAAGLNLTTLTGGDCGGSNNTFQTRNGFNGGDWRQGMGAGMKYACGQTINPFVFADAGTAPSQGNNNYVALTANDPDFADFTSANGATQMTANTQAKTVNCATGADAGAINSGFKVPLLVCDQRLHSFFFVGKVQGGQYTAKATMANGEKVPVTFAVTDSVGGTPLWTRVDYRSVAPTTIQFEVRRTIQNDGPGNTIFVSCFYLPPPIAAPIPRGSRNLSAYFAQASR